MNYHEFTEENHVIRVAKRFKIDVWVSGSASVTSKDSEAKIREDLNLKIARDFSK